MSEFQNQNMELVRIKSLLEIRDDFFFDESRNRIEENPTTAKNCTESPEIENLERSRQKVYLKLEKEIIYRLNQFLDQENLKRKDSN